MNAPEDLTGITVGTVVLERVLARGGMGWVYRGRQPKLDREVAVKVIDPRLARGEWQERFLAEARTLAKARHPNVVQIYDIETDDDGRLYLIMELVEGQTLDQAWKEGQPWQPEEVVPVIAQIADALAFLHEKGIVHRDLKPANIHLDVHGHVRLLDFGIAQLEDAQVRTRENLILGTPAFLAPEVCQGEKASPASDQYALAMTGYQLLRGALPFQGATLREILVQQVHRPIEPLHRLRPEVSVPVGMVFERAMAKDPMARYHSVRAFGQALRDATFSDGGDPNPGSGAWSRPTPLALEPVDPQDPTLSFDEALSTPVPAPPVTPGSGAFPRPGSGAFPRPGSGAFPNPGSGAFPTPGSGAYPTPGSWVYVPLDAERREHRHRFLAILLLAIAGALGIFVTQTNLEIESAPPPPPLDLTLAPAPGPTPTSAPPRTSPPTSPPGGEAGAAGLDPGARDGSALPGVLAAPPGPPIRVGILHSRTGRLAPFEAAAIQGAERAVASLQAEGGVLGRPLEVVAGDGASDPATFLAEATRLIDDERVAVVFGCWSSACRRTVRPLFEARNHLLVYPLAHEGLEQDSHVLYTGPSPMQDLVPAIRWLYAFLEKRDFYVVGARDVYGVVASRWVDREVRALGGDVEVELIPAHSLSVTDLIEEIVDEEPDVVVNLLPVDVHEAFFAALRAAGVDAATTPTVSFRLTEREIDTIGVDLVAGDYLGASHVHDLAGPWAERLREDLAGLEGRQALATAPFEAAYAGVLTWAAAATAAGSIDARDVRAALGAGQVASPSPAMPAVDPSTLHLARTPRVGRIEPDGSIAIVWEADGPAAAELFPPGRSPQAWTHWLDTTRAEWPEPWWDDRRPTLFD